MVFVVCFFPCLADINESVLPDSAFTTSSKDSAHSYKPIVELDRMVVTASKRSMAADMVVEDVKVVTAKDAKASGTFNAMELLDGIPGMDIDPARTQTNLVLNGMSGSYVKILMDGIPVTGDVGGGFPLENLVMGDVDRIEVMSGASSTMYGTDAIGGVVNFISERPNTITPLRLRASYNYLNNDSIAGWGGKNRLDLNATHGNQFFSIQGYYGFDLDNGSWYYDQNGRLVRKVYCYPESDRRKGGVKLAIYPSDKLILRPSASYSSSGVERNKANGNLNFLENIYSTFNLAGSFESSSRLVVEGYGSAATFSHLNREIKQDGVDGTIDTRTDFLNYDAEIRCHLRDLVSAGGDDNILAGVNVLHERIDSDNLRKGAARTQAAIFVSGYWESATAVCLIINPSLRFAGSQVTDANSSTTALSDICPKIGLRLNDFLITGTHVSASYGHAYQVPRFKNMYYAFNMGNMMWIEGNEELKPEKSDQFNGGMGYRFNSLLEIGVDGFYNSLTNMIVLRSVLHEDGSQVMRGIDGETEAELVPGEGIPEKTYVNALRGYKYGVSLGVKFQPLRWMNYTCHITRILSFAENDGGTMLEEEHYTRNAIHLSGRLLFENLRSFLPSLSVSAIWKDRQIDYYDDAGNPTYLDSYTKLNLLISKSVLKGLTIRLGANNLLDYQRPGHPGLDYGRTYTASIDMNIDNITQFGESIKPTLF